MSSNPQAVRDLIVKPSGESGVEWTLQVMKEAIRAGREVRLSDVERLEADVTAIIRENRELRAKIEPAEIDAEALEELPCILGRWLLCDALRKYWPYFWRRLNDAWTISRQAVADGQSEQGQIMYAAWCEDVRISDANPWIEGDIVKPTVEAWAANPNSPDARLDPKARWWQYRPSEKIVPNFRYIANHRPLPTLPYSDMMKIVDAFCEAEKRAHTEKLDEWRAGVKKASGAADRGMMITHARWTVLFIGGKTPKEIAADRFRSSPATKTLQHPDKYVRNEIGRFSKGIGLVLPRS